jgi:transcriptional regulator GlxA family with amidase domain
MGAARALEEERPERAVIAIVDTLRSWGMSFARPSEHDLRELVDPVDDALQHHLSRALSNLAQFPDSNELTSMVGLHPRAFTRRLSALARDYHMPWSHFRSALHHTRIVQALRLLASAKATTESVARLTGFRAPTALCHAFAKAGLPSPGVLGQAARKQAIDAWTAFAA